MSQPTSPFTLGLKANNPFAKPLVKSTTPLSAAGPVTGGMEATKKRYNPFLAATNTETAEFKQMYGVNKPLEKPMFLGYRNEQAVFGGSRLFLLY